MGSPGGLHHKRHESATGTRACVGRKAMLMAFVKARLPNQTSWLLISCGLYMQVLKRSY